MNKLTESLEEALTRKDLLPSLRSLAWVLVLFGLAIVLARSYATPIGDALADHGPPQNATGRPEKTPPDPADR